MSADISAITKLPHKRALTDSTNSHQNIPPTSPTTKKRKVEPPSSTPRLFPSSQNDPRSKLSSSQPKSAFESDVLEKLSQDASGLRHHNAEKDQVWDRPALGDFNAQRDKLCFQAIETEEGTMPGGKPTIRLFGVTEGGNSVMLHVRDFKHYLYVAAPTSFQPSDCPAFQTYLNSQVKSYTPAIHSVNLVMRMNIYRYQGNVESPYLKVTVTDPRNIGRVRATIEDGKANWKGMWSTGDGGVLTFDNIQYVPRFMVDCHVSVHPPPSTS
ncbi:hypothetical protein IMZ48_50125 [Candidatus Bathyarchaeota archaeon]|nr:hypothetical protein [Candidatus Bathyarchaeota archaeon]